MTTLLESNRLIIKTPAENNLDDFYAQQSDSDVMQYIGQGIRTREEVKKNLEAAINHYRKHGFTFGPVYEKESDQCIGQAGLIYLGYDDSQPDIEIGYRFLKKHWHKGYATELSREMIKWGFSHLPVKKLVGIIQPKNEKSRHVLEKVGMHYVGTDTYHHYEVARYEIEKNPIDFNKVDIVPALLADYPAMQNMARFYVYDMSRYLGFEAGWELPADGLYECIDFKMYWEDAESFPFLIKYQDELAGFVIIDKKGSDNQIDYNVAQFFILNKFKKKGIGQYVARQCFDRFKGIWEVRVMPGNESGYRFWRPLVKDYTQNNFQEYSRPTANKPGEHRNFFRFRSP